MSSAENPFLKPHRDPWIDITRFLRDSPQPLLIDVGANEGQTVAELRQHFPNSTIHAFEPSPTTFAQLQENCGDDPGVTLWNCGVGARQESLTFTENSLSVMSSFLPPGELCWGETVESTAVDVVALNELAAEQNWDFIHLLKSDTQGFDLEVFRGAEPLLRAGRVGLIYFEVIFSAMYQSLPAYFETFRFLDACGFRLVSFYDMFVQQELASWSDALFIHTDFYDRVCPPETRSPY